jgi:predicted PolB exonuclease-like 3'-5' exonuclease
MAVTVNPQFKLPWHVGHIRGRHGFARANGLDDKPDDAIREATGDKFPKHVYHSIVCIGALIATDQESHWSVEALGAPHVGDRTERELIASFVNKIDELKPQLVTFNGSPHLCATYVAACRGLPTSI